MRDLIAEPPSSEPPSGVVDRPHVSPWLLWSARHFSLLAERIEKARPDGRREPWIEHRAYVIASLAASVEFLEAFVNELFQDVEDQGSGEMGPGDPLRLITVSIHENVKTRMRTYWSGTKAQRPPTLQKYKELLVCAGHAGVEPRLHEDASFLVKLRHAVVHYLPRDYFTAEDALAFARELKKRRIAANPLAGAALRAYWPEKALSSALARWGVRAATRVTDFASQALGIDPSYSRIRRFKSFGQAPGSLPDLAPSGPPDV